MLKTIEKLYELNAVVDRIQETKSSSLRAQMFFGPFRKVSKALEASIKKADPINKRGEVKFSTEPYELATGKRSRGTRVWSVEVISLFDGQILGGGKFPGSLPEMRKNSVKWAERKFARTSDIVVQVLA